MNWKVSFGLAVLTLIYILVGALVFYVLEHDTYTPVDITDSQFYKDFLANNPSVASGDLENFTRAVVNVVSESQEVVVAENVTEKTNGWTYDNAVYFTITVVSTIGYGHISPKTVGGKWFCIFFALVGIPMAVALLAVVGSRLKVITQRLHRNTRSLCPNNPARDRQIKSAVVLTVGTALMLCVPALVFMYTEDWDYLSALYYATITLTTVGFGDYVAGGGLPSNVFRILLCLWLIVGLAFLALVISEASELYSGSGSSEEDKEKSRDDPSSSELPEPIKVRESSSSPVLRNGNTASVHVKL